MMMKHAFTVLVIALAIASRGVQGFLRCGVSVFLTRSCHTTLNMVEKTPLVTSTGKRLEVDGGSSLMAVKATPYDMIFVSKCTIYTCFVAFAGMSQTGIESTNKLQER